MKNYTVYFAGSTPWIGMQSSCITKACKEFIKTLEKPAKYEIINKEYATVTYLDNYSICADFVIQLV